MISGKKYSALFLQIMIITLAFLVVPAAANAPPTVLEGTLMIDGEPAPVGTEVALVVDGNVVGQTTVTNEGLIGDERANRLGVPSDYDVVTVYVDGEPKQTLDLSANNDDSMDLDLSVSSVETPVETPTEEQESSGAIKSASTGGSGGSSSGEAVSIEEESASEPLSQVSEETKLPSTTESTTEENVEETSADEGNVPESVFGSSMILVLGLMLVGVVVAYRYRSK